MHLNHPETIPLTMVPGKIVFHEIGPWCQKHWGLLVYIMQQTPDLTPGQGPPVGHQVPDCGGCVY